MAISRQRLTAPLVRGNMPEEHAAEFSNGLVEEVERELEPLATKVEVNEAIAQATEPLARAITEMAQAINDLRNELRLEMRDLRSDMNEELSKLRSDTNEEIGKLRVEAAEREARMARMVLTMTGINIGAIATAVGIVLGFN